MPLIDMAGLKELPSLQAEAAQALASLAETKDDSIMVAFCKENVFEAIRKLLKSNSLEVLYPMVQLLKRLANDKNASELFNDSLKAELEEKTREKTMAPIVSEILSGVLSKV